MLNKAYRWLTSFNWPSYVVFFVTARCNATCKMCFYKENMDSNVRKEELTIEEYRKITKSIKRVNILGISGGEPYLRDDLHEIINTAYDNCSPLVVDCPTNAYFPDRVAKQVEFIVSHCKNMTLDLQLSVDGPPAIHDEIRNLKNGFERLKETYHRVIPLKKKYKNLRVKACVVYSHFNQHHIDELFDILNRDFKELDRVIFSVAHGTVWQEKSMDFDWNHYFAICKKLRDQTVVNKVSDVHSIFTKALRIVKNDFLKNVLNDKDMYRHCKAGKSVLVINEKGEVFPCEPLWKSVGRLRDVDYNVEAILKSEAMEQYQRDIIKNKCNCHWSLPMSNAILFKPAYYPQLMFEMGNIMMRTMSQPFGRREANEVATA